MQLHVDPQQAFLRDNAHGVPVISTPRRAHRLHELLQHRLVLLLLLLLCEKCCEAPHALRKWWMGERRNSEGSFAAPHRALCARALSLCPRGATYTCCTHASQCTTATIHDAHDGGSVGSHAHWSRVLSWLRGEALDRHGFKGQRPHRVAFFPSGEPDTQSPVGSRPRNFLGWDPPRHQPKHTRVQP